MGHFAELVVVLARSHTCTLPARRPGSKTSADQQEVFRHFPSTLSSGSHPLPLHAVPLQLLDIVFLSPRRQRDRRPVAAAERRSPRAPGRDIVDRELERLVVAYAPLIFHVAFSILHDRGLAEDVVQETMIKAWRHREEFRGDSSLKTWLIRIGRNTAIDALRRRRDQFTADGTVPETADRSAVADVERLSEGRADLAELGSALGELDELSRTIVILREIDSLSYQEIADALEVPVSTVKTRLLRARRTLQETLGQQGVMAT